MTQLLRAIFPGGICCDTALLAEHLTTGDVGSTVDVYFVICLLTLFLYLCAGFVVGGLGGVTETAFG